MMEHPHLRSFQLPAHFNFSYCLAFLDRNKQECLHTVENNRLYKWFLLEDTHLMLVIYVVENKLLIESLNMIPTEAQWHWVCKEIIDWLDLKTDLTAFYQMAEGDSILGNLSHAFRGLRLIGIPDLFEALSWAIIGQQINLNFAYALKKRWVEHLGVHFKYKTQSFYHLPTPAQTADMSFEALKKLQFSRQKIFYLKEIARLFLEDRLNKSSLAQLPAPELEQQLTTIKGVGPWTAQYVMMKCFRIPSAIPLQDAGLHQALKKQLHLETKPAMESISALAEKWHPFESYATFYLWYSLML